MADFFVKWGAEPTCAVLAELGDLNKAAKLLAKYTWQKNT